MQLKNCDNNLIWFFFFLNVILFLFLFDYLVLDRTPLRRVECMDFSPGGGYLAMGNNVGRVLLYKLNQFSNAWWMWWCNLITGPKSMLVYYYQAFCCSLTRINSFDCDQKIPLASALFLYPALSKLRKCLLVLSGSIFPELLVVSAIFHHIYEGIIPPCQFDTAFLTSSLPNFFWICSEPIRDRMKRRINHVVRKQTLQWINDLWT